MEQEEDKKIGRPSLTVCMFCGLIFGLAVSAGGTIAEPASAQGCWWACCIIT